MSETEFKRTMENLSDTSAKMVASCLSPFSELLRSLCDFSVSTVSIICKTGIAKHEIFECTNPGINQYLRKQGITDPEAHIRYWIEKMHRGEVSDLFTNTSNVVLAEQQLQGNQSMMQVTSSNSKLGNKTYPITYNVSGASVHNITAMEDYSTLVVYTDSNTDGTLTIQLPRNIIDSKHRDNTDEEYVVFADGQLIPAEETTNNDQLRILAIDFEKGVEQIEIQGSQMVPITTITSAESRLQEEELPISITKENNLTTTIPTEKETSSVTTTKEAIKTRPLPTYNLL